MSTSIQARMLLTTFVRDKVYECNYQTLAGKLQKKYMLGKTFSLLLSNNSDCILTIAANEYKGLELFQIERICTVISFILWIAETDNVTITQQLPCAVNTSEDNLTVWVSQESHIDMDFVNKQNIAIRPQIKICQDSVDFSIPGKSAYKSSGSRMRFTTW